VVNGVLHLRELGIISIVNEGNRDRGQADVDECAVPISVGWHYYYYYCYLALRHVNYPGRGEFSHQEGGGGGWLRAIEKVTRRYSIREQEGGGAEGPSPGEGCRRIRHEGDRLVSLLLFLPRQEGVLYAEAVWD